MTKIIVAVDESQGSRDAIALASTLAGVTGSTLTFANVFPYDLEPSRAANGEFEEYLRQDSRELLERLRDAHGNASVELKAVANASAAHGLHELAEREDADLIVVGSTHTGRAGRVLPGSTAERLLHGAPCPVAVAPKGYAERPRAARGHRLRLRRLARRRGARSRRPAGWRRRPGRTCASSASSSRCSTTSRRATRRSAA